jgi:hypothetical protein
MYDSLTAEQKEELRSKTEYLNAYLGKLAVSIARVRDGRKPRLPKKDFR